MLDAGCVNVRQAGTLSYQLLLMSRYGFVVIVVGLWSSIQGRNIAFQLDVVLMWDDLLFPLSI